MKRIARFHIMTFISLTLCLGLTGAMCEDGGNDNSALLLLLSSGNMSSVNMWTWMSGASTHSHDGVYGTKGVAASTNMPGSREDSASWVDSTGTLWLFGGIGYDSAGDMGPLSDLWKYDGTNWTWVSGYNTQSEAGIYGTKGVAASTNIPGGRYGAVSWIDSDGYLWLFGGYGHDSNHNSGKLNDLWKYNGTDWTWVSGSNLRNQPGTYGTKGTAAPSNMPGGRYNSISWINSGGTLWLFGGSGYDYAGSDGSLNDLWRYDGTNWTWVSGSSTNNQPGTYGTLGVASPSNVPGARDSSSGWVDSNGALWLFGGQGYTSPGPPGYLNDLWKYDGTNWTWMSGSNLRDQPGTYGEKGVEDSANVPGARFWQAGRPDSNGGFWLFGGIGYDSAGNVGSLNDLWRYDGTNWTWISGPDTRDQEGTYGDRGVETAINMPGARRGAICWMKSSGDLWFFGGYGYDSTGTMGYLHDLWRYRP